MHVCMCACMCVSGVKFDVDKQHRDQVHIHSIPACMAQREANDRKRGKDPLSYEYVEVGVHFVSSSCLYFGMRGALVYITWHNHIHCKETHCIMISLCSESGVFFDRTTYTKEMLCIMIS